MRKCLEGNSPGPTCKGTRRPYLNYPPTVKVAGTGSQAEAIEGAGRELVWTNLLQL